MISHFAVPFRVASSLLTRILSASHDKYDYRRIITITHGIRSSGVVLLITGQNKGFSNFFYYLYIATLNSLYPGNELWTISALTFIHCLLLKNPNFQFKNLNPSFGNVAKTLPDGGKLKKHVPNAQVSWLANYWLMWTIN